MDNQLLNQLYHKYQRELYLYLYSLCGNSELAEDLLQETFLKALLSLNEHHTNVRAWLYMVARNLYYNYYKKEKRRLPFPDFSEARDERAQEMLDRMLVDENRQILYQALRQLEQKKREILEMQYFGKLSQKEIAVVLQLTLENVRVLAYRAKRELKSYLEVHGYDNIS